MKELSIKELRIEKGFSQSELAKRIGVSRQTIVNYEKGEVIPESKKELLYSILQGEKLNILHEEANIYHKKGDKKLQQTIEKLEEVKKTIKLAKEKGELETENHFKYIAKLLQEQINLINTSNKETEEEEEILKKLDGLAKK